MNNQNPRKEEDYAEKQLSDRKQLRTFTRVEYIKLPRITAYTNKHLKKGNCIFSCCNKRQKQMKKNGENSQDEKTTEESLNAIIQGMAPQAQKQKPKS